MSFIGDKFHLICVGQELTLRKPDGGPISQGESMKYLGCHISATGESGGELRQRLGAALAWPLSERAHFMKDVLGVVFGNRVWQVCAKTNV